MTVKWEIKRLVKWTEPSIPWTNNTSWHHVCDYVMTTVVLEINAWETLKSDGSVIEIYHQIAWYYLIQTQRYKVKHSTHETWNMSGITQCYKVKHSTYKTWNMSGIAGARRAENKLAEAYMLLCMGQLMIYGGDCFEAQRWDTVLVIVSMNSVDYMFHSRMKSFCWNEKMQ